jgi:putative transposase
LLSANPWFLLLWELTSELKRNKLMGQSLVQIYIHLIFTTKHRRPLIYDDFEDELYAYLGGICKVLQCNPIKIKGDKDHVHILCMLSKKIAVMKLLEELKSNSSKWMKTKSQELNNFLWQDGYGAFSVNPSEIDAVISYIDNQKEHHKKITFQEEYVAFLKKYKVEYDENYVWG